MLRALSLTQRLTLFFTACAAVIVVGLGLVFIQATQHHFVDLDRDVLQDKQHLIEDIIGRANSAEDARWRLGEALNHHQGLYVSVRDAQGAEVFKTEGFLSPPSAQASAPVAVAASASHGGASLHDWEADGQQLRYMQFRQAPAYAPAAPYDVLLAVDTVHHTHFLVELRQTLLFYALAAVALSGVLAWLAAHQGLAPLREMRAKAAAVWGHQFSERMPVEAVPIEMADLATELNNMLGRLQDEYRRLSEFSSDLAHELRTPISNLLTQTQVALSAKRDGPTYREILASNAEELERMARMVADMLFLAKAERGMTLPNREQFSAAQEVRALLEFYDAVAEEKGARLSVSGDALVDADRLMFRRAISNLLSNAIRHGDPGSPVEVAINQGEQGVSVCVQNSADDIPAAALPRLFDRFFRVDPARSHPASEGSGLGLSITKAIVEAHGGEITATSQARHVRMVIRLPSAEAMSRAGSA
jgi:two-component system heavy metal sensor histidine kinase CusS